MSHRLKGTPLDELNKTERYVDGLKIKCEWVPRTTPHIVGDRLRKRQRDLLYSDGVEESGVGSRTGRELRFTRRVACRRSATGYDR